MDSQVFQLLLAKRRIAYLITNRNMLITDVGGNSTLWASNTNSQEMNELPIGRQLLDLIPELASARPKLNRILMGTEHQNQEDYVKQDVQDKELFLRMTTVARRDRAGQIVGLLHVIEDISEIGLMRHKIEQLRRNAHSLRAQLDIVAHELGTPLTLIAGYLDLLKQSVQSQLSEEQSEYLNLVMTNMERLMVIANDLADMMYAEEGRLRLTLQPVDIGALLQNAAESFRPLLRPQKQQLHTDVDRELPLVACDLDRVTQIVRNLLSNASSFSPHYTAIHVGASLSEDGGSVQIWVADSGIGIHPDDKEKVFERFYRSRLANQSAPSGIGIGLYISRILVELHGGRIWCENGVDAGTIFSFTLPVQDLSTVPLLAANSAPSTSSTLADSSMVLPVRSRYLGQQIHWPGMNRASFSGH